MPENVSALHLLLTGDPTLFAIVWLSLIVTLSATLVAALIGVPVGAFIALTRFRGREPLIVVLNAFMGLPPVVAGLAVFLRRNFAADMMNAQESPCEPGILQPSSSAPPFRRRLTPP